MYFKNEFYQQDLKKAWEQVPEKKQLFHKGILLTGAGGMIASFAVDMLMYLNCHENADIQVYAMGRNLQRLQERFASYSENPLFHIVIQDVTEPFQVSFQVDYVIHAAGDGYPAAFRERPVETMMPAFTGTFQLLDFARKEGGKRFLYVSSGEVYGQGEQQEDGFSEDYSGYLDSTAVRSCYPMAKRGAETLCIAYGAEYGLETVIARLSHVYGPNLSDKDNRATAQFIRDVMSNRDIELHSEGKQMRSYTYVADCVSGMFFVLLHGKSGEAYNIANPKSRVTIAQFAEKLAVAVGRTCVFRCPAESEKRELTPITYAVLNTDRLYSQGWKGSYTIDDGIEQLFRILKGEKAE